MKNIFAVSPLVLDVVELAEADGAPAGGHSTLEARGLVSG